jgi:meiotic recombination protein SPO11
MDDAQLLTAIDEVVELVLGHLSGDASAQPKSWLPSNRSVGAWRVCAQLWMLLARVQVMVKTNRRQSLRDLHYQLKQTEVFPAGATDVSAATTRLLDLLGKQLGRSTLGRSVLRITAAPKGFVAGPLVLTTADGVRIDPSFEPWAIPGDVAEIGKLRATSSRARYILVVEKHTVFQQLVDCHFHREYATVLCTGRGFPDMGTRAFVKRLSSQLGIVPFSLTDWNPSGLQIHLSYKEGNGAQARMEGAAVRVPSMLWIGLHHEDVQALPASSLDRLSTRDHALIRGLLARSATSQADKLIEREVRAMLSAGVKADLDHVGRGTAAAAGASAPLDLPRLVLQKMLRANTSAPG